MQDYHSYIYDKENEKIKGDFEGAYRECDDVWPTQHNMTGPNFNYARGLILSLAQQRQNPLTVLDIGCGYGDFVADLAKFNIGNVIGYDISQTAIEKGLERFGSHLDLRAGSLEDINLEPGSCDIVLLFGVLWFLLDDVDGHLEKISQMMADNGELLLTLHVPESPIGKEIIGSYEDLTNLVSKYFKITGALHWYQDSTIENNEYSLKHCDMLLRCQKIK